jgi:hypothetical protein
VDRRAFKIDLPQVGAAKIGVAKVGVAKDDFVHIDSAKIDSSQIGSGEIDHFSAIGDPVESVQFARPQALIGFVVEKSRFVHGRFLSRGGGSSLWRAAGFIPEHRQKLDPNEAPG